MDQEDVDKLGWALAIVDLAMLAKGGAKFARNKLVQTRNSKAIVRNKILIYNLIL
jgi:hypothetical protein